MQLVVAARRRGRGPNRRCARRGVEAGLALQGLRSRCAVGTRGDPARPGRIAFARSGAVENTALALLMISSERLPQMPPYRLRQLLIC